MPKGLRESEKLSRPMFTPSTKAEQGEHDENIHPDQRIPQKTWLTRSKTINRREEGSKS